MEPKIRIGILNVAQAQIKFNTVYIINNETVEGEYKVSVNRDSINFNDKTVEKLYFKSQSEASYFTIEDVIIGVNFHWQRKEHQTFQGDLEIIVKDNKLHLINVINIEDYLVSVISSEMSAAASLSLLKAHAVISRSWLLAQLSKRDQISNNDKSSVSEIITKDKIIRWYDREDHTLFDVCADDHCQRYQGITRAFSHIETVMQAIKETKGEVLEYESEICDTRFSKCCGGVYEEFKSCWENEEFPYLKAKRDDEKNDFPDLRIEENAVKWIMDNPEAYCNTQNKHILSQVLNDYDQETTNFYRWKVEYTSEELSTILLKKTNIDFGVVLEMNAIERGTSGRIMLLEIIGTKNKKIIGKELEIRKALSNSHLYSSAFVAEKTSKGFILYGAGWGHGVGLCQIGAAVMGEKGISYNEILDHYFPKSRLVVKY